MQEALQAPEKRKKKVTKVALAKKILNKGIVAGQKVKFNDDGTPSDAADLALQAAKAEESVDSDYEGMFFGPGFFPVGTRTRVNLNGLGSVNDVVDTDVST